MKILCMLFGHEAVGLYHEDYARDILICYCGKRAITRMEYKARWAQ